MSILEAYCNKCTARAGENGYECDRCAKLPHVKPIRGSVKPCNKYGGMGGKARCPKCRNVIDCVPGNLELCEKCDTEFVSVDPERDD
jgi:hypothetical protein